MWARSEGTETEYEWGLARIYDSSHELRIKGDCVSIESSGAQTGINIQTSREFEVTFSERDLIALFEFCIAQGILSFKPTISVAE